MNRLVALSCCLFPLMLEAASNTHSFTIDLPQAVPAESVFLRYRFPAEGDSPIQAWQPRPGVRSILIDTARNGHPASRIRGLLVAPGCAIQQFDVALPPASDAPYVFHCIPVPNIPIRGTVVRLDRLYGRQVEICAEYAAHWEGEIASIPIGTSASLGADGTFQLTVPDLTRDPALSGPGEIRLWAKERGAGGKVARLDRGGSPESGSPVFTPCAVNPPQRQDSEGFSIRPDYHDACGPSQKFDLEGFAVLPAH